MTGKEFETIRTKIGWSKREVAKRLNVGNASIYNYINSKEVPGPVAAAMEMYAEKFRVDYKEG